MPGHSLGATRPQERRAARDLLLLDCWVNAPSLVCLDRHYKHTSITSPPASGPKPLPELTQSMASRGVLIHVKNVSAKGG